MSELYPVIVNYQCDIEEPRMRPILPHVAFSGNGYWLNLPHPNNGTFHTVVPFHLSGTSWLPVVAVVEVEDSASHQPESGTIIDWWLFEQIGMGWKCVENVSARNMLIVARRFYRYYSLCNCAVVPWGDDIATLVALELS